MRYAVVGNPVAHSLSPWLHTAFARQTQRPVLYAAYRPPSSFAACADAFFASGGAGLNITLPYKADALAYANSATAFAQRAGAANVLTRQPDGGIRASNTDGGGLLADLRRLLGGEGARGMRVRLLGAGGAASAAAHAIAPVAAALVISNRTPARAQQLAAACGGVAVPEADDTPADIVINATSAGHGAAPLQYPPDLFSHAALAYDLSYGAAARNFLHQAAAAGARQTADGLGMLAYQAALSFAIWQGLMPAIAAPLNALTQILEKAAKAAE